jgi:hypothetical protein
VKLGVKDGGNHSMNPNNYNNVYGDLEEQVIKDIYQWSLENFEKTEYGTVEESKVPDISELIELFWKEKLG